MPSTRTHRDTCWRDDGGALPPASGPLADMCTGGRCVAVPWRRTGEIWNVTGAQWLSTWMTHKQAKHYSLHRGVHFCRDWRGGSTPSQIPLLTSFLFFFFNVVFTWAGEICSLQWTTPNVWIISTRCFALVWASSRLCTTYHTVLTKT